MQNNDQCFEVIWKYVANFSTSKSSERESKKNRKEEVYRNAEPSQFTLQIT